MDSLIANSNEAYADLVANLMRNDEQRKRAQLQIIDQRPLLFGDREPIAALERFFEEGAKWSG